LRTAPTTTAASNAPTPAAVSRLADCYLEPAELLALVADLAADAGVAATASALHPGDGARDWKMVHRDANVDVWLIVWNRGADTGWHDHDRSAGAFHVLAGGIRESRPSLVGRHQRRRFAAGDGASFGPDHVHRVTAVSARSVTIHAYSPPLCRMGRYTVDVDGALRRHSLGYDEELEIG
jgi:predicted metal-dependent enzyme (double-stranded beta helix superfamily)